MEGGGKSKALDRGDNLGTRLMDRRRDCVRLREKEN